MSASDRLPLVAPGDLAPSRVALGRALAWGSGLLLLVVFALQATGWLGLATWRPTLCAYLLWAACLCWGQVLARGERGRRALFVLPAVLFLVPLTVGPLLLGVLIALGGWDPSHPGRWRFGGPGHLGRLWDDRAYWTALGHGAWHVPTLAAEYAVAFGLALMLDAQVRGRRFFRVAFLLPLTMSPLVLSWAVGTSLLEPRWGALARLGWDASALGGPLAARLSVVAVGAWTSIPLMTAVLLAGLQALPRQVREAARMDGATGWRGFREVTFPLMLPASLAAVLMGIAVRLRLAGTSGGLGGADTVTGLILREHRSDLGYATLLALVDLAVVAVVMAVLGTLARRAGTRRRGA